MSAQILLSSRLDAVSGPAVREPVDLLGLLAEECAQYPDAELEGVPAIVAGDPRLLRRLARNLLENAQRHGQAPTRMELSRTAAGFEIRVEDAGAGIPPEAAEQVFEPFFRRPGAEASGGAGLGLALVRKIARHHGGEALCLASATGRSCFVITLPASGPA